MSISDTSGTPSASAGVPVPTATASSPLNDSQVPAWSQLADHTVRNDKILVVDNDEVVQRSICEHLSSAGYKNILTTDESATAFALIFDERPDLVLMDFRMAVRGFQLLETVKGEESLQQIPIVILTSSSDANEKLEALRLGANDFLNKSIDVGELLARVRNNLLVKAHCDQLTRYSQKLEKEVYVDALTETGNRRAFEKEVQLRLRDWNVNKQPLALLLIDIDHFKKVNDCYGHRAGDQLLKSLSRAIQEQLDPDAVLCRYGGEELAVLLSGVTVEAAKAMAESIRTSISEQTFVFEEVQLSITISIGATVAIQRDNSAILFQRADSALYASKQSGRNCCHFNDGNMCARTGGAASPGREADGAADTDESAFDEQPTAGELTHAKIMIIDDEPVMILTVKKHLKDGGFCQFITCDEPEHALTTIRREQPDVILLDIRMPKVSGLEILSEVRNDESLQHIPVVVLTSSTDENTKSDALQLGAFDFLAKPVNVSELLSRVRNTLMVKAQHDRLAHYSQQLEFEINRRMAELFASRSEVIHCLASAAECRDDQTGYHIVRVGRYAVAIAREMNFEEDQIPALESAAQLHDVGKIGVPDSILLKKGPLTDDEREIMKDHADIGVRILKECNSPVMRMAATVASAHHEKWDGTGYPNGLAGTDIPLVGRITAVADVFDALSNKRHYKEAFDLDECFGLIEKSSGTHFDPSVVAAFLRCKGEILQIFQDYVDPDELKPSQ